jgi:hypothetical protein
MLLRTVLFFFWRELLRTVLLAAFCMLAFFYMFSDPASASTKKAMLRTVGQLLRWLCIFFFCAFRGVGSFLLYYSIIFVCFRSVAKPCVAQKFASTLVNLVITETEPKVSGYYRNQTVSMYKTV